MSWIDNIQNDLIITTGGGEIFRPLWLNATKVKGYNVAEFEFPNVAGTLVNRTTSKGARYALELYFQGDDHLEQSRAFETAAEDSRPWVISHPFYGIITVQPTELSFDNTRYNISRVTGTVIETITEDRPKTTIKAEDNIALQKAATDEAFVTAFDSTPTPADANTATANNNRLYKRGKTIPALQSELQGYFNVFNTANAATNKITSQPASAMRATQSLINAPASFTSDVKNKTSSLSLQYQDLRGGILSITTRAAKQIFATNGAAIISAHALAALNPLPGNLRNRVDVINLAEALLDDYNQFIADLDTLQSDNGGDLDSYIPDVDSFILLNRLIKSAITGLFSLALNARQQRTLYLPDDTDLINLTHLLYGLDQFDDNIDELVENNGFALNEILELKKDTKVIYYI